jgi:dihydrofolate synthase / folylpolyglutamate synthase
VSTPDERLRAVARSFPARKPRASLAAVDRLRTAASLPLPARAIAVVGTNGKTSTATYVERLLRGAGLSTGLTVSPHLRSWGERVVVDGDPIPEETLAAEVEALNELAADRDELRFFDLVTLAAAAVFRRRGVDVAVFEAGIGGRLDATAVLRPSVVALTSVSLDHVELLGDDPASILREKLGIAPPGATVVSARLGDELEEVARELWPAMELVDSRDDGVLQRNASLAEVVARRAVERFGLDAQLGRLDGFAVAGRLQREVVDGVDVLIDAAHNPGAWDAVRSELPPSFVAVLSTSLDRPVDALAPALAGATVVVATTAWHGHTTEAVTLAAALEGLPVQVVDAPAEATRLAFTRAKDAGVPLVALGSTYLVPHVLDELGL